MSKFGKHDRIKFKWKGDLEFFILVGFFALPFNVNGPPLSMKLHREEGRTTSPKLRRAAAACHWGNE